MPDSNIFDQAGTAIQFLEHLAGVELGWEDSKGRELNQSEKEVKDSALTLLLEYFVADYSRKALFKRKPKAKKKAKPKVRK